MTAGPRLAAAALVAALLGGACSDDDDEGGGDAAATAATAPASTTATTAAAEATTTTTAASVPEGDPLEAAEAFLRTHLPGTRPVVGEFQQGDARSGEVPVLRPAEGGGAANLASTLLLRVVDGEWQVIGAVNPFVTIESPGNGAEVDTGPVIVSGSGRGFEATLVVEAHTLDGDVAAEAVGTGGAQAEPAPYEVTLDLAGVSPGTELVVVVAGGTGLEGDPGEFAAVRITT